MGLSLSHFLLLWVLPLPPSPTPCFARSASTRLPRGQGSLSGTMCPRRSGVSGQRLGEGIRAAARTLRGPGRRLVRVEVRGGRPQWGRGQKRLPRPDPGPKLPSAGPRVRSVRRTQPLDSARGWATRPAPPRPAPPSCRPLLRSEPAWTGPQTQDPGGPSRGDGHRPRDPGRERRTETLGVGTRWAAAPAPTAPTWAARIASRTPAPPPARPRVSPGPGLGRGTGVGLRGKPRVRGARGGELPPLPVVPKRPRPPPPYRGAAPAGPRPAPAHWLRRARCRLRGPGAAADPLSALCLPLARRPPPLSAPRADPALRTAPRASRLPASRNPSPRRPAQDRGRDRSRRVRPGGLGSGTSTGGEMTRVTNGAPDEAAAKDNWARLGLWLLPFPRSGGPAGVPARLPRPLGRRDGRSGPARDPAVRGSAPPQAGPWGPPWPPALSPFWRPAACACGAHCSGPREGPVPKRLWGPTLSA